MIVTKGKGEGKAGKDAARTTRGWELAMLLLANGHRLTEHLWEAHGYARLAPEIQRLRDLGWPIVTEHAEGPGSLPSYVLEVFRGDAVAQGSLFEPTLRARKGAQQ